MVLLKTLVALEVLWLLAVAARHWRDRSPGPYIEPRFSSPIDKPRCRVCAGGAGSAADGGGSSGTSVGEGSSGTSAGDGSGGTSAGGGSGGTSAGDGSGGTSAGEGASGTSAGDGSSGTSVGDDSSDRSAEDASAASARPSGDGPRARAERSGAASRALQSSDGRDGTLFVTPDRRDDLKRVKGIGEVMEGKLNALGITTFEQLASFEEEDIERVDATLENFQGRIERDRWVEQAAKLARGEEND